DNGDYTDPKSKSFQENYDKLMQEYVDKQNELPLELQANDAEVLHFATNTWLKVNGGKKKGRSVGCGNLSSNLKKSQSGYIDSSTSNATCQSQQPNIEEIRQLWRSNQEEMDAAVQKAVEASQKVEEEKREKMQQELLARMQEERDDMQTKLKRLEDMMMQPQRMPTPSYINHQPYQIVPPNHYQVQSSNNQSQGPRLPPPRRPNMQQPQSYNRLQMASYQSQTDMYRPNMHDMNQPPISIPHMPVGGVNDQLSTGDILGNLNNFGDDLVFEFVNNPGNINPHGSTTYYNGEQ
ncbi:hypothetical protein L195_g041669, partial [Trifolium pratense]